MDFPWSAVEEERSDGGGAEFRWGLGKAEEQRAPPSEGGMESAAAGGLTPLWGGRTEANLSRSDRREREGSRSPSMGLEAAEADERAAELRD